MRVLFVAALLLAGACAPVEKYVAASPVAQPTWQAMRAEHRVQVEFMTADGGREKKALRGAIAVQRPDRFRLAALGPGGVRLFDLLVVDGQVSVLYAFRQMEGSTFAAAVRDMAADLSAAYLLDPAKPDRAVATDANGVTIKEAGRTVKLSRFAQLGTHAVPTRINAETDKYKFAVEVVNIELDPTLDPQLFKKE